MKNKLYRKFKGKTAISDIGDKKNCRIAGRIINITKDTVTVEDESGIITLSHNRSDLKYLDIAVFNLIGERGKFTIKDVEILTRARGKIELRNNWQNALINREKRETFKKRELIIQNIRDYFLKNDFIEINSPYLVFAPSTEETLKPFKTVESKTNGTMYLTMSPEYNLKRFLSVGFERIFQIAHSFRDEEYDDLHNPEFLNLEWYRAYADYMDIMDDLSVILPEITDYVHNASIIEYRDKRIDMAQMEKISIRELFFDDFHEELESLTNIEDFRRVVKTGNIITNGLNNWNDIFYAWIVQKEPTLGNKKPCIIYDYPKTCAALSRLKDNNNFYAERFELYIGGIEIANAYSELNDPIEQKKRLKKEIKFHENIPLNEDFQRALEIGMPPSGGIAFGLDRFIMILLGKHSIHDIIPLSLADLKNEINTSPQ
ncbi:hypothetical protein DRP44_04815 [candidate division TA06 bacterium]|uniref:Aminoacyl-transfer RNA synthetases class-II family profile domain-containing protein n=1 Tax=candidate division TA06 bacterium TaxID=2250710 RepID=A0A660S7S2_UNCT6|nr:MAG: hypothetical protein DRP44_04815 [candidate division TA06 bacterium]